jgi:hypothetical protein
MRLQSQRTLLLPGSPEEVWRLLSEPARLSVLAPEVEDAWPLRDGLLRVVARLGRRRRAWSVRPTLDAQAHRLELDSATSGVSFHLEASIEPAAEGSTVRVAFSFEPPETWKANPQPGIPRRVAQRLLMSVLLFSLSAFGVVELPSLSLSRPVETAAYAVVGLSFVLAAALLSGAHGARRSRSRRRFLGLPASGGREARKDQGPG